jgi:hypothetical protein
MVPSRQEPRPRYIKGKYRFWLLYQHIIVQYGVQYGCRVIVYCRNCTGQSDQSEGIIPYSTKSSTIIFQCIPYQVPVLIAGSFRISSDTGRGRGREGERGGRGGLLLQDLDSGCGASYILYNTRHGTVPYGIIRRTYTAHLNAPMCPYGV